MVQTRSNDTSTSSPLQALVIGIDKYKSANIEALRGAVADADDIARFLRTEMHVPDEQIVNLRNEAATRKAILHEVEALQKREARAGDPFLIYYAGHGTTAEAVEGWVTGSGQISMLVPYDGDTEGSDEDLCVHNIPDRTVGALLHALAESKDGSGKGDNITVIMDCCHSGSGTRGLLKARRIKMAKGYRIPSSLDKNILSKAPKERGCKKTTGFLRSGLSSHVLLAACREDELAYEQGGRGLFTRALLCALRSVSAHKITYQELMKSITIKGQTPQCEGNTNRILFNALSPSEMRTVYPIVQKDGRCTIDAGLAHGVYDGARFHIYSSADFTDEDSPLTTMTSTAVKPFISELCASPSGLASSSHLPRLCFALQASIGHVASLRLHLPLFEIGDDHPAAVAALPKALLKELQRQGQLERPSVRLVDPTEADLSVHPASGGVEYRIHNAQIVRHGLRRLWKGTEASVHGIRPILHSAGTFFWHLFRSPNKGLLRDQIVSEVHKLLPGSNGERDSFMKRLLARHGDNLFLSGSVNIVADDQTAFGITLENHNPVSLHVWGFYFDCSDLSITELYRPPAIGIGAEPSIPAQGSLSIGYGAGGGRPFTCFTRSDQDLDVGFLKFFFTTEFVDLGGIAQMSPFEKSRPRNIRRRQPDIGPQWDTISIPVVQHRTRLCELQPSFHSC
ncbi:unnamed protein product [Peniophora sp. CBMAI 1063]|nr:unnamed protein product [Peniophora sp. CBMAI 1063]